MNVRGFAGILLANQITARLCPNKSSSSFDRNINVTFSSKGEWKEINTFLLNFRLVFILFKLGLCYLEQCLDFILTTSQSRARLMLFFARSKRYGVSPSFFKGPFNKLVLNSAYIFMHAIFDSIS